MTGIKNKFKVDVILWMILFITFGVLSCFLVKSQEKDSLQYDKQLFDEKPFVTQGYSYNSKTGVYRVVYKNPYSVYYLEDEKEQIYGLEIKFADSYIPENMVMYYSYGEEMLFTEFNSISVTNNTDSVVSLKQPNAVNYIRLDIPVDYKIDEVYVYTNMRIIEGKTDNSVYIIAVIISLVLAFVLSLMNFVKKIKKYIAGNIVKMYKFIIGNKLKVLISICIVGLLGIISYAAESVITNVTGRGYLNKYEFLVIFTVLLIIFFAILLRKKSQKNPEILFAIITFMIGMVTVIINPPITGVSWDDPTHYARTVKMSYLAKDEMTYTDRLLVLQYATDAEVYERDERLEWYDYVSRYNTQANQTTLEFTKNPIGQYAIAYVPSAVGIAVGRAIDLTYIHNFMLGKIINLLCYTFIFYISARMLKRGKLLVCMIGMIPTSLFMAANYSYDWWIVAFTVLGYCMFVAELQKEKDTISLKKWIGILVVFIIAYLPKAIYFPLIFPLLFMAYRKFGKKKYMYIITWAMSMIILMLSFVLPMLFWGTGGDDMRGGSDVNSAMQIQFILQNPFEYARILLNFLSEYLSLDAAEGYMVWFAYWGEGRYYAMCLVLLVVAAVLEGKAFNHDKITKFSKGITVISVLGAVVLIATALYVSFTGVAYDTVNGCQPRYLLPCIFPGLYFLLQNNIDVKDVARSKINTCFILLMAFIMISNAYQLCVSLY